MMKKACRPLLLLLVAATTHAYPAYDNPILATPALVRPGQLLCTVDLVRNAACDAYDKVTTQPFPVPSDVPACRGYVSKVVLDFDGAVKGVQFDRSGGVFLGEVELLRTTTPEPTPMGIAWHVEKDVSDYISYILDASQPKNATVGITNIVDKTYTGVIFVNVTLSFYGRPFPSAAAATGDGAGTGSATTSSPMLLRGSSSSTSTSSTSSSSVALIAAKDNDDVSSSSSSSSSSSGSSSGKKQQTPSPQPRKEDTGLLPEHGASPPLILPLVSPFNISTGQWTGPPSISGNTSLILFLPPWPQPNIARVYLDLMASPHGCEEFFYTNLPSESGNVDGSSCGGGVYRELQVWVDDKLAGSVYPAVVLYTGGVNPFLWRPLSGIESFDVPAYRFDLTPFAGLFNSAASVPVPMDAAATATAAAAAVVAENEERVGKNANDSATTILTLAPAAAAAAAAAVASRPKISLRAYGNNNQGVWSITSALLLHPDPDVDASVTLSGGIDSATDSGPQGTVEMKEEQGAVDDSSDSSSSGSGSGIITTYKTVGYHAYSVSGSLHYPNGTFSITTTVTAHLSAWNENILLGNNTQRTRGSMADQTSIERHTSDGTKLGQRRLQNRYPYFIQSYYASDNSSVELRATIDVGLERSYDEELVGRHPFAASFKNRIKSKAVYNRSVDHSHTGIMFGESSETFQLFSSLQGTDPCYDRALAASEGHVSLNKSSNSCLFPPGLDFCGYQICEQLVPTVVSLVGIEPGNSVSTTTTTSSPVPVTAGIDKGVVMEGGVGVEKEESMFEQQLSLRAKAALEGVRNPIWTLNTLRERLQETGQNM